VEVALLISFDDKPQVKRFLMRNADKPLIRIPEVQDGDPPDDAEEAGRPGNGRSTHS